MIIAELHKELNRFSKGLESLMIGHPTLTRITAAEGISDNSKIYTEEHHNTKLHIGKYCSISMGCSFFLGANHRYDRISTFIPFDPEMKEESLTSNGDIIIGNDVWIGYGATILSGVKIGTGSVIGANSLVSKDVEPYSIVAGNPASPIKFRFNEETIKFLLDSRWWDLDVDFIIKNQKTIFGSNIEDFKKIILSHK